MVGAPPSSSTALLAVVPETPHFLALQVFGFGYGEIFRIDLIRSAGADVQHDHVVLEQFILDSEIPKARIQRFLKARRVGPQEGKVADPEFQDDSRVVEVEGGRHVDVAPFERGEFLLALVQLPGMIQLELDPPFAVLLDFFGEMDDRLPKIFILGRPIRRKDDFDGLVRCLGADTSEHAQDKTTSATAE